ncbi:MAG: signal peptidase I [Azoarcus sp.]|nr:signal peptidase I [Azoarcus sp.]
MNLAQALFVLLLITGALWAADRFYARARRDPEAPPPGWVEWGAAFFPVVLVVFVLRSFIVEPFKIPSGSMIPTLLEGDFILVNKFIYGIRLPVVDIKIIDVQNPRRGEIMVFRYPLDPSQNYIKRVVGLPGDRIDYIDKRLTINGEPMPTTADGTYVHAKSMYYSPKYTEKLGDVEHNILIENAAPPYVQDVKDFKFRENCTYTVRGFSCMVPAGHYLVMGDNRDNSADSRVWGFVPDENIVGHAFFVWFNFSDLKRIGRFH